MKAKYAIGFGLRNLYVINKAYLANLDWNLYGGHDEPQCKVLMGKYKHIINSSGSLLLRVITLVFGMKFLSRNPWLPNGFLGDRKWQIDQCFGYHYWVETCITLNNYIISSSNVQLPLVVSNLLNDKRYLEWCRLRLMFSLCIHHKIACILPRRKDFGPYAGIWGRTNNETFTAKISYESFTDINRNNHHGRLKKIWNLKAHEKIQIFI